LLTSDSGTEITIGVNTEAVDHRLTF